MKSILILFFMFAVVGSSTPDRDYLLGKFDPATDPRFIKLRPEHTAGAANGGYLRKETYAAFIEMSAKAKAEGVSLTIISATRNFKSQKQIWENKWTGKVQVEGMNLTSVADPTERAKIILRYSSMPGSSRHHWGTDMDLNDLNNSYFETGDGVKTYQWLTSHAAEYGFCQPYTTKASGRTGYEEEKWHWSYVPLSVPLLRDYVNDVRNKDITGFKGSETARSIRIIEQYVQGVSCK